METPPGRKGRVKDGREREGESADKENKEDGVKGKTDEVQKQLGELEERPDGSNSSRMRPRQRPRRPQEGLDEDATCVSVTLTRVNGTKAHVEFIGSDGPTVQTALLFIFKNNNGVPESRESPIPPQPGAFLGAKQPRIAFITHFLWQKTKRAVKGSKVLGDTGSRNNFILIQMRSHDSAAFPEHSLWLLTTSE